MQMDLQISNWRGCNRIIASALQMLRPPPDLKPSEWAERNLKIPEGNAVPGFYRIMNAPFQREPIDQFINPECRQITLMWGAQTGKTTAALVVQGYAIGQRPRSQMMMQPSQGDLKTWLETKFNPLVDSSPELKRLIAKPRGREGVNNQSMKSYPGGFMMFAWAGSTRTMRGRSAPLIVGDEVDGYGKTDEGDPISLIWQRAATFGDDRFLFALSTPTIKGLSYIESLFLAGDQRYFWVKCPHCGEAQILTWANVYWKGRQSTELHDAEADLATEDHDPASAGYACEHCGALWNDGERIQAVRTAEENGAGWRATKPFKGHASYHAWEAYSTFRRLQDIVQDYLDKLKIDDLQSFANVSLSRTYELKGDGADPDTFYGLRHEFPGHLPDGVLYITLGADMQMDRLEYEIVGWGANEESWSLEYGVLWGDPLARVVFDDLHEVIRNRRFTDAQGKEHRIKVSCLDTGGTTGYPQAAWDWLKGKTGQRIFGVKGHSPSWGKPIVQSPSRKRSGKNSRRVDVFNVAVDEAKMVVMRRISQTVAAGRIENAPGYMHVPEDRDPEWFKQITAEKLYTQSNARGATRFWGLPPKTRNEALDCRVYAYAALKIGNPSLRPKKKDATSEPETPPDLQAEHSQITPDTVKTTPKTNDTPKPNGRRKRRARLWRPRGELY